MDATKMSPIKLQFKNQHLSINPLGGGIMEYYLLEGGNRKDIIYGYENDLNKSGSMGDVLFPFPGRVENSQYTFNNQTFALSDVKIKDGHAIHGFAKVANWSIIKQANNFVIIKFVINSAEYKDKGFPFDLSLTIKYQIDESGLSVQSEVENVGENDAPFGLGFHPYFTVGTVIIDEMRLQIKAKKLVEFDPDLKPTGKLLDVTGSNLDFNDLKVIGSKIIDNCYTSLKFQKQINEGHIGCVKLDHIECGTVETVISDGKDLNISIWQDENFPYLQVYSADTIGEEHRRRGFAIEPQTCTGFAFNVEGMGLKVLQPKEIFKASWGVNINHNNSTN